MKLWVISFLHALIISAALSLDLLLVKAYSELSTPLEASVNMKLLNSSKQLLDRQKI